MVSFPVVSIILMRSFSRPIYSWEARNSTLLRSPQCIARDLRHPDRYHDGSDEAEADQSPVLPAVFHGFTVSCGRNRQFARSADVNVKKRAGDHPAPAREYVRPELHAGETVKVIAEIKRDDRTEPE